jgi:2-C-methyl-D-erythritol 2,4-cyclodiphosphate synthase
MLRTGHGFDVHRLQAGRPFLLGGVLLDWPTGPVGHSDGDVLLHALMDAMLGASGLGDIGDWFPPADPQWEGANSADLLGTIWSQLQQAPWRIVNIDATIILEAPRVSPYKAAIKSHLAGLLAIHPEQVNIKAKTMEGLGPIGEQQAVAAWVSVLLERSGEQS